MHMYVSNDAIIWHPVADPETSREGGEFANKLLFFLKIYQYIKIKYEQLY